jgi:hypothetical protein
MRGAGESLLCRSSGTGTFLSDGRGRNWTVLGQAELRAGPLNEIFATLF